MWPNNTSNVKRDAESQPEPSDAFIAVLVNRSLVYGVLLYVSAFQSGTYKLTMFVLCQAVVNVMQPHWSL